MPVELGQIIDGKYRVIRLIGEGGMGCVYEGENSRISRRVAIKVMHAEAAANPEIALRFAREAQAAARIGSAHIVDVLDLGDLPNGDAFMVMEFLVGESLAERMKARLRLGVSEVARIAHQILEGLASMHSAGIIHRDLKPANIFMARTSKGEIVKILDFGVSKFAPLPNEAQAATTTGMLMGTPYYMAPEQARGAHREVNERSDIYALGVVLYRCLCGELPFVGENAHDLLFKIALGTYRPLTEVIPDLDPAFVALVHKAMSREPADRYQNARAFQAAIIEWGRANHPSLAFDQTVASQAPPPMLPASSMLGLPPIPGPAKLPGSMTPPPTSQQIAEGKSAAGAWSGATKDPPSGEKKSKRALFAIVGVVALAAVGVTLAVIGSGKHADVLPPATATTAVETPTASAIESATPTAAAPEPTPVPAAVETAVAPAASVVAAAAPHASAKSAQGAAGPKVTAAPSASAVPAASGAPSSTTPGKRKIRTDL
ncbi:MAG: protein kinase [Polyangiaceae bacterium]